MVPSLLLAVYLAPAGFVLLNMIRAKSFSLYHISSLRRLSKRITLVEWLVVYGYLAVGLESRNQPPRTRHRSPWRVMVSGVAFVASLFLFFVILPFSVTLSFAQHDWNAFPAIQVAIAGGVLALSLMLAFHRTRGWHLVGNPSAEYPYLEWEILEKVRMREKGKTT